MLVREALKCLIIHYYFQRNINKENRDISFYSKFRGEKQQKPSLGACFPSNIISCKTVPPLS